MAAVMCIGETKHKPSFTPLLRTARSTCSVMCTISLRFLVSKTRYSVWLFIQGLSPQFFLDAESSTVPQMQANERSRMLANRSGERGRLMHHACVSLTLGESLYAACRKIR